MTYFGSKRFNFRGLNNTSVLVDLADINSVADVDDELLNSILPGLSTTGSKLIISIGHTQKDFIT
jgi:hypothetical protein